MAIRMGDSTPSDSGLSKFNPFLFIDKLGLICFILFSFGWAKSITFDSRNFKNPVLNSVTVILTGMAANLIAAILFLLLIILYKPQPDGFIYNLFFTITKFNFNYFFFNFLPFIPLSAGRVISIFYPGYHRFEIIGIIILILILIFNLTSFIDIIVSNLMNIFI
ncbi:MAG: hypothetical protein KKH98_11975 [Spirochaetes bacterium]|nr:hypothetical protein [Spirochaetota bacterium]